MTQLFALHFSNLLLAGLLAGSELGIHYGVGPPPPILGDAGNLLIRQAAVRRLRILIPGLFLPTAITGIAIVIIDAAMPGAWFRWAALLCIAVWIATRALVTVPVNSAVMDWAAASPPTDWKVRVARAQRFHIFGVWASLIAFICFLAATLMTMGNP